MPQYWYQGRETNGHLRKGKMEAESSQSVARQLSQQGIVPVKIEKIAEKLSFFDGETVFLSWQSVLPEDIILLCRQLHTLVKAGVPVLQAFRGLSATSHHAALSKVLLKVSNLIASGKNVSDSLAEFPQVFSSLFVNIIRAGEESGHLEAAFRQLASYLNFEARTIKRLKSALRYPSFVLTAIITAILVINFFVIPSFANLFSRFNTPLPLPTRMLMATSHFFLTAWPWLLLSLIGLVIGATIALRVPRIRYVWDWGMLRWPVIGFLLQRIYLGRFARSFTMVLRSGIALGRGLELVANTLGNHYIRNHLLIMRTSLERGEGLARVAARAPFFSPMVLQMMSVGEESGAIVEMLEEVAMYYEEDVDYDLNRINELIEPLLLVCLGGIVLVLALGVFLPMWDMVSFIRR